MRNLFRTFRKAINVTSTDRFELDNLIGSNAHRDRIAAMRTALGEWIGHTDDLGRLPESELLQNNFIRPLPPKQPRPAQPLDSPER